MQFYGKVEFKFILMLKELKFCFINCFLILCTLKLVKYVFVFFAFFYVFLFAHFECDPQPERNTNMVRGGELSGTNGSEYLKVIFP